MSVSPEYLIFLATLRRAMVGALVALLCLSLPDTTLGQSQQVYLFVDPDYETVRSEGLGDLEAVTRLITSELKEALQSRRNISAVEIVYPEDRGIDVSVDDYIRGSHISHYIRARVYAGRGGVHIVLSLVADSESTIENVVTGPMGGPEVDEKLRRELRASSFIYSALMSGISSRNFIFVECVKTFFPPNTTVHPRLPIVRQDITVELPNLIQISETKGHFMIYGMNDQEYIQFCAHDVVPMETDMFNYVIYGMMLPVGDDPSRIRLEFRIPIRDSALRPHVLLPSYSLEAEEVDVPTEVAKHISDCWLDWHKQGCQ